MRSRASTELSGFCTPLRPFHSEVATEVVAEYARAYTTRFLDTYNKSISPTLLAQAQEWTGRAHSFDECWDITQADIRRAVLKPSMFKPARISAAAVGLGLRAVCRQNSIGPKNQHLMFGARRR
jgi:hypothetical protein